MGSIAVVITVMDSYPPTADDSGVCVTHMGESVHCSWGDRESSDAVMDLLPPALGTWA